MPSYWQLTCIKPAHNDMRESSGPVSFDNMSSNQRESLDAGVDTSLTRFNFRRPDRISKTQLRAIHNLHESLVRNLASSLSAYLRAYLTVSLASVEQVSYGEFRDSLRSPTCLVSMSLRPYEGNAVLELNPSLVFPIIEFLLVGSGKQSPKLNREVTEIELKLLESLFRIILQDLQGAWRSVANIAFAIESIETETQALRILAPQEAVVAIGIEIRIGETSGMMNLAIPSIVVKMMRQKFDRHWSIRKLDSDPLRRAQILQRIRHSPLCVDAVLTGASLSVRELASLEVGDVVSLPQPVRTPITLRVNGVPKYQGRLIGIDGKRAVVIASLISEVEGT